MGDEREQFFKMVDGTPVHPLVGWARDEIVRLEKLVGVKDHKLDLAKERHTADKEKLEEAEHPAKKVKEHK